MNIRFRTLFLLSLLVIMYGQLHANYNLDTTAGLDEFFAHTMNFARQGKHNLNPVVADALQHILGLFKKPGDIGLVDLLPLGAYAPAQDPLLAYIEKLRQEGKLLGANSVAFQNFINFQKMKNISVILQEANQFKKRLK